jgi:plastocyanin
MNRTIIGLIVVIVIVAGGWLMFKGTPAQAPTIDQTPAVTDTTPASATTSPSQTGLVAYRDYGFYPESLTVPLGTTVEFLNQSSGSMWVASAAHPSHTAYSGTSLSQHCPDTTNSAFDECLAVAPKNSFFFTFDKVGTWKYHNHVDATKMGTIIVTATATEAWILGHTPQSSAIYEMN